MRNNGLQVHPWCQKWKNCFPFLRLNNIPLCVHYFFIYLCINRHSGCFNALASATVCQRVFPALSKKGHSPSVHADHSTWSDTPPRKPINSPSSFRAPSSHSLVTGEVGTSRSCLHSPLPRRHWPSPRWQAQSLPLMS